MRGPAANPKYIAVAALIAVAVLGLGVVVKPKKPAPQRVVSEAEESRLKKLLQKKSLDDMAAFLADAAMGAAPHLVHLPQVGRTGLTWDLEGAVLTSGTEGPLPERVTVLTPAGGEVAAETVVAGPDLPVAVVQAPAGSLLRPVRRLEAGLLRPGQWVVAVWRNPDGSAAFGSGLYSGLAPAGCVDAPVREIELSLPVSLSMLGGGVFDLDGNLAAVVVRCGGRLLAIAVEDVDAMLERGRSPDRRALQRWGIRLEALDKRAQEYFRASKGLLVTEVWEGYPGERAGLVPGDVILAAGKQGLEKREDLPAPGKDVELRVQRARRNVRMSLPDDDAEGPGIALRSDEPGIPIESVAPGSGASRAGLRAGDRLVQVDGQEVQGRAGAEKALVGRGKKPVFVVLAREGRQWGVFLDE